MPEGNPANQTITDRPTTEEDVGEAGGHGGGRGWQGRVGKKVERRDTTNRRQGHGSADEPPAPP